MNCPGPTWDHPLHLGYSPKLLCGQGLMFNKGGKNLIKHTTMMEWERSHRSSPLTEQGVQFSRMFFTSGLNVGNKLATEHPCYHLVGQVSKGSWHHKKLLESHQPNQKWKQILVLFSEWERGTVGRHRKYWPSLRYVTNTSTFLSLPQNNGSLVWCQNHKQCSKV